MKIGIISDIHSNLPALETVLSFLESESVECIVHAGDVVGYNPFPNEVIKVLKERKIVSISGNHDRATITGDTSWFNPVASISIFWTMKVISNSNLDYLKTFPLHTTVSGLKIYHGSPFDSDEYVYEEMADESYLTEAKAKILVLGHTHIPFIKKFGDGIIINPGSVGQPRDGKTLASCAIFESVTEECTIHRLEYDIERTVKEMQRVNLPSSLWQRMLVGR